jgi:hypothetical protein
MSTLKTKTKITATIIKKKIITNSNSKGNSITLLKCEEIEF